MRTQRGATLIVALIMLVLMTLAAVTSYNLSRNNLVVVNNQQHRAEVESSAKAALEEALSHNYFSISPTLPLGTTNAKTYDVNGDGVSDVNVTIGAVGSAANPPPCIKSYKSLKNGDLDDDSLGCIVGIIASTQGVEGADPGANSLCADNYWELTAVATDSATNASVTAVQGIRVRESVNKASTPALYCQ